MNKIFAKNVSKDFSGNKLGSKILNDINLSIAGGESLCIMGDSGSGKTTLLNILSGLDRADKGEISWNTKLLNEYSLNKISQMRRNFIGFVFQSFHLIPDLNVFENVYIAAKILSNEKHTPKGNINKQVYDLLKKLSISHLSNKSVVNLSGGEKQRVAIARSLINNPDFIFADEPTGNLDDNSSHEIINILFSLVKDKSIGLILVTHNQELSKYCDRILKLKNGKLNG